MKYFVVSLYCIYVQLAFDRNGFDGLSLVLGEKVNGVVRVTKHGPTIQRIFLNNKYKLINDF